MATNISIRLYAKGASSPTVHFFFVSRLNTGREVEMIMNMDERKRIREPMNIQNSREFVASSLTIWGICLYLTMNKMNAGKKKISTKITSCAYMPASTKACTELSPRMPLRVRKVSHSTIQ